MRTSEYCNYTNENWYISLDDSSNYTFKLICKYHTYFKSKDKFYQKVVHIAKISTLFLSMVNTIVLGLNNAININTQVNLGLVISAALSLIAALVIYFNFEEYWMRNITIHIQLNILRDKFIFDASAGNMNCEKSKTYLDKLEEIQQSNIKYWEKAINNKTGSD